jgi:hypothetical protein
VRTEQAQWRAETGWQPEAPGRIADPHFVLVFGPSRLLESGDALGDLRRVWPTSCLFGCSTAGEIRDTTVADESLVATAIRFDASEIATAWTRVDSATDSFQAGVRLASSIAHSNLRHAFVLSDGLNVNGSDLVRGLTSALPPGIALTGGLSGDGDRFAHTVVLWEGQARSHIVGIIGFYGDRLSVGTGSLGGWDPFGPERLITRSDGNVLYELDGRSALDLYKTYLGEHAEGLPATGLLFPLSLRGPREDVPLVRTVLAIDEHRQSMTFAGDMPQGTYARFMKANFDRLVDGAHRAADASQQNLSTSADLAVLISCVGRKLVLRQRIEEEVEAVRDVLGTRPVLAGFYSYGEISPFTPSARCELHNQTMTITTFAEAA